MSAEHSSEEGGEGLSDEARNAKTWYEYAHPTADELADWLLTIPRADLVKMTARFTAWGEHATYCRADDLKAERDDLRGRLAALRASVWALGESIYGEEGVEHNEGCEGEPDCLACILDTLRAALANPSAAQGEGEA